MEYPKSIEIKTTLPRKYLRTQQKISTILSVEEVTRITVPTFLILKRLNKIRKMDAKNQQSKLLLPI